MRFESEKEIERIALGFIEKTLPREEWTHAAHFATAVWLLCSLSYIATEDMPAMIRRYNESTGIENTDSSGYHQTITTASLLAAAHYVKDKESDIPLYCIVNEILDSELGEPAWIFKYWSETLINSAEARKAWVNPDLRPFPFDVS